ncbi:zinc-dependent metalloprotease [Flavobacterium johnsoniae]|uniref:Proprotein convertase, P n=1 Tax=Flavobacterium johnsoniae (strain ATCC 17061 / DSM 2064 / JCM 8514 / BCRC 14874 / CCUG 350202 / NBRC 14942 / NCIMB 11054 / UW101) TaxID=376686 RepID=A5FLU4_FLAJ1|nr:zinc-dependent metalloprotease family protein [Flavobacterium johnsoniae]ABQ03832.1 Proprotein convertase, P [Flavobacterium johnsoniae UW101]OXG03349.1 T9SS C-terminal target domain-containing protein [Flavobacterium johnsoniae UW101]WQG79303.1 zinc-dependent metalloprotease family protein [Flavobacterium johnsoniae UW101]SHK04077.1 Por secretion system C-terminal sorting domain-containing protein [Flavobacterium johnsoniae]
MKKLLLFLMFIFCCVKLHAQSDDLWQKVSLTSNKNTITVDSDKLYYRLNTESLKAKLSKTSQKSLDEGIAEITIPNTNGVLERFQVSESSNFDPELQAKYPEIRAYQGSSLDDKSARIHLSVSPKGIQTMVLRGNKKTEFIEQNPENREQYVLFSSDRTTSRMKLDCKTIDQIAQESDLSKTAKTTSNNKVFKTLQLALSCTGEYAAYFGGTKALALGGMNATLTRVNGILNRDLAVKLVLIANNDAIIYLNASTDPYSGASAGAGGAWNQEVQTTLTNVIGNNNYDIGHLFGASGGGGNAGCIGCVCRNPTSADPLAKGSAYTSPSDGKPEGDTFDIDFVIHEMGHQLGANHTFSYDSGERTSVNVEPGSGSTIMGYAGITDDYDIQNNSDDYFAYASILQIQNTLASKSCPVSSTITNNPPAVNAGIDYTIPISTPFVLKGSSLEANNITYNWEEYDNATTTSGTNSTAYPTKPNGPLFRSVAPSSSQIRYMPSLSSVLQNKLTTTWESVSSINRTLNFTLTGRDNGASGQAQTNTDAMVVNVVSSAGPFAVTSHNIDDISWWQGYGQTVTWSVNNTNNLQGSSTVNIKLSTDGGLTFPITLASNTPNDGSEFVIVPESIESSTNCRILIEPIGNIYYALNSKPFAIGYVAATTCNTYSFGSSFSIPYSSSYTARTVNVPAAEGNISDVNVSINVTHTRFSDLEIEIVNPQGTTVRLFNKSCGGTSSTLALQFDDSGNTLDCAKTTTQIVFPADELSVFNGQSPEGTWTFRVRDAVSGMFGTVNSASVNICTQVFTLDTIDVVKKDFVLYPNPNKGSFTVQFKSESTSVKVFVNDILGKTIYAKTFETDGDFNQNIFLPNAASGLYLVTVIDGDKRTVRKIIIN